MNFPHFHTNLTTNTNIALLATCLHHAVAQAPANDICNAATVVASTPFNSNSISTSMATSDVNTNICNVAATDVGVWYSFLGNDKIVQIVLTDSTFNAKIALFSGPCNNPVCVDNSGSTDILTFPATLNVPYLILISGVSQSKGTFNLAITVCGYIILNTINAFMSHQLLFYNII